MISPHLAAFAPTATSALPPPPSAGAAAGFERRERLRRERSRLVAELSRRSGDSHRELNGRVNREVGVASVGAATLAQLERANALLARELERAVSR